MKRVNKTFFSILFVLFLDNFGFAIIFNMFAPLILFPEFGLVGVGVALNTKNILLALLYVMFPLSQFFGAPIIGGIADHFGRKKAFFWSLLGLTLSFGLSAVSLLFYSLILLFISRLFTGFFAGNFSICLATASDISAEPKVRSRNFGIIGAISGISWIASMLIGGLFVIRTSETFGPMYAFWLMALLSVVNIFIIWFFFTKISGGPTAWVSSPTKLEPSSHLPSPVFEKNKNVII